MKVEKLNMAELRAYCREIGIDTKKKKKKELIEQVFIYRKQLIQNAINTGQAQTYLVKKIEALTEEYAIQLSQSIAARKEEMKQDDTSHYLIYRVLGISSEEGKEIDDYQNVGRFLYKYAGSFLEEAASLCLEFNNLTGGKAKVPNGSGRKPKTFEIDFLDGNDAIELKWRDATTDGDHITKEHTRIKVIQQHGYKPIRVMFYTPQRAKAITIQDTLKTIYQGVKGEYYAAEDAWNFILNRTGFDLKAILEQIANKRTPIA
ncbi:MAG: ApaLI family restriction endonuclease [Flammeovirgaceae bacterium]